MRNRQSIALHIFLIGIALAMTAIPSQALPQTEPIGTVVALRGAVNAVTAAGESRALAIKAPVFAEDSIDTGNRGRIQLLFTDNTIMSLGQNTKMKIAEYRWSETAAKEGAMKTQVKEGTFRVLGGAITKAAPKNFTTETPSATIGIRGSSYAGKVSQDNLTVVLLGGTGVNIFNEAGMVPLTKVGFGTVVAPGKAPIPPFKFTPQDLQNLGGGLTSNGEEQKPKKRGKKKGAQTKPDGEPGDENGGADNAADNGGNGEGSANGDTQAAAGTPQDGSPAEGGAQEGSGDSPAGGATLVNTIASNDAPTMSDMPVTMAPIAITNPQVIAVPLEIPPPPPPTETTLTLNLTPTIPTNGIEDFIGWISGTSVHDGIAEAISDPFYSGINWYNRKFMGFVDTMDIDPNSTGDHSGGPVFFFGSINSDGTIASSRVIGTDHIWDDYYMIERPARITGGGSSGLFLALSTGIAFGFDASGYTFDLATQSYQDTWVVSGSGINDGIIFPTSPTGSVTWKGFVTGLAEDINNPSVNRGLFTNSSSNDFTMTINRDSGTLSGSFLVADYTEPAITLNVTVGGSNASVYVADEALIALLSGTITNVGANNLLPNSNFLVTEDPDKPKPASYVQWGVWEAAYIDPDNSAVYDIHQPGTYWVAGVPTTPGTFPTGSYTYSGNAYATKITTDGLYYLAGTTSFNISFNDTYGAGTINSGSITIPSELSLSLGTSVPLAAGAFTTTNVSGVSSGKVNGNFFGPNAKSLAGNFTAVNAGGQFLGIYGGDRP